MTHVETARRFRQKNCFSNTRHADKADIKDLQQQVQALTEEIREMKFDNRRDRENAAHEHKKLLLRLEVTLLRSERRSLTGKSDPGLLLEDTEETLPSGQ